MPARKHFHSPAIPAGNNNDHKENESVSPQCISENSMSLTPLLFTPQDEIFELISSYYCLVFSRRPGPNAAGRIAAVLTEDKMYPLSEYENLLARTVRAILDYPAKYINNRLFIIVLKEQMECLRPEMRMKGYKLMTVDELKEKELNPFGRKPWTEEEWKKFHKDVERHSSGKRRRIK